MFYIIAYFKISLTHTNIFLIPFIQMIHLSCSFLQANMAGTITFMIIPGNQSSSGSTQRSNKVVRTNHEISSYRRTTGQLKLRVSTFNLTPLIRVQRFHMLYRRNIRNVEFSKEIFYCLFVSRIEDVHFQIVIR